jgi:recombination protein RecT
MSGEVQKVAPGSEIALQLEQMAAKFREALPKHIPVERFTRIVSTAIQQNPSLLKVERRSLWQAAMKSAQDGLLPDGREAALVVYRDRNRGEIAQYMPMIAGIRKKVRNSGDIATWDAQVVYENDEFEYELGDNPFIRHRPAMGDRGKPIAAYSIAVLKSGEKTREVMSAREIEAIRGRSRAKDSGPWVSDWSEMARKTVARRHSKVLPMSTDLDDLVRRDDDLYEFQEAKAEAQAKAKTRPTLASTMDALAAGGGAIIEHHAEPEQAAADEVPHDPDTGEVEGGAGEPERTPPLADPSKEPPQREATKAAAASSTVSEPAKTATPVEAGRHAAYRGDDRIPPARLGEKGRADWIKGYDAEIARLEAIDAGGER